MSRKHTPILESQFFFLKRNQLAKFSHKNPLIIIKIVDKKHFLKEIR
jgi:hypothetical protein